MAKIWPVYEGREPTRGGPWADIPLEEAIALLNLRKRDLISSLEKTPRFGDVRRDLWYLGYQHVVVEVEPKEASEARWKPGFYKCVFEPKEVLRKIIERAAALELGEENVVRVDIGPSMDLQGGRALRVTVVIGPEAAKHFGKSVLDALVRIQQLGEEPTVVVDFATEAELQHSGAAQS